MKVGNQNVVTFKSNVESKLSDEHKEFLLQIANSSDPELNSIAKGQAIQNYSQDPTRKVTNTVGTMIPYVDSFVKGAKTPGTFSTKAFATADSAKDWGVFIVVTALYNKLINKLIDKSPRFRKFTEEHPTATFIGTVGSGLYVANKAVQYVNKAIDAVLGINGENRVEHLDKKFGDKFNKLPGSKFINDRVLEPIGNFLKKPAGKWLGTAALIGVAGLIIKNIYDVHKVKSDSDKTLENLKEARYKAAREVANQLASERDIA